MVDEFEFFSNDCNNWNYNPFINTPNADPYNLIKRTKNISSNNSYNLMKYNAVIMLKEILKHTSKYLNNGISLSLSLSLSLCVCICVCVCVCVCDRNARPVQKHLFLIFFKTTFLTCSETSMGSGMVVRRPSVLPPIFYIFFLNKDTTQKTTICIASCVFVCACVCV